jgi:predicted phage terminase large subunit-like protein
MDAVAKRMSFVETIAAIEDMTERHPEAVLKLIEDKANGPAIISMLNLKVGGMVPVDPKNSKEVSGGGSKVARASAVSPLLESGNIFLPCSGFNPDGSPILDRWVRDIVEECAAFPLGEFDDQCLIAGTKVATLWGDKNIEDIKAGDKVITPYGICTVSSCGCTGEK